MKITVIVGGRFHADRMAHALLRNGHDVHLITSLPKSRFSPEAGLAVQSVVWPELLYRGAQTLGLETWGGGLKMAKFGQRAHTRLSKLSPQDCVVSWSSFGLESFLSTPSLRILVRDSAHISTQIEILKAEYHRLGLRFPNHERVKEREEQEYALADHILVPSLFAKKTFEKRGIEKVSVLTLGVDTSVFSPNTAFTFDGKRKLRVIYFGTLSIQKGVHHLLSALSRFQGEVELSLIGSVDPEFRSILKRYPSFRVLTPLPHRELAKVLKSQDVFVLPSLHDGFGMVVPQAMAAGLVPIVSNQAGASELIEDGKSGFVIPAGTPEPIFEKIRYLSEHPLEYSHLREAVLSARKNLSWERYGQTLNRYLEEWGVRKTKTSAL